MTTAGSAPRGHVRLRAEVAAMLERAGSGLVAVLLVDVDELRRVNADHGHDVGDALLATFDRRLRAIAGDHPAFRFGGDEFAVLWPHLDDDSDALALAGRIVDDLGAPMGAVQRSVCVGVALAAAERRPRAEALIDRADRALHDAKALGRGRIEVIDDDAVAEERSRAAHGADLDDALRTGLVAVRYEPEVALADGVVRGAAVVPAWQPPGRRELVGRELLAFAGRCGLGATLLEYVLDAALEAVEAWPFERGPDSPRLSVAVPVAALADGDVVPLVQGLLDRRATEPAALALELDGRTWRAHGLEVRRLRTLGPLLAVGGADIDGPALAALRELPVDRLLVDRAFVRAVDQRAEDAAIVEALVQLAQGLGLSVVAADVATTAQAQRLQELGCGAARGPLWGPPRAFVALRSHEPVAEARPVATEAPPAAPLDPAHVVAHEVRSPLSVVLGQAELLAEEVGGQALERVQAIDRAARRIERLLGSLLDTRLAEAGRLTVDTAPVALGPFVTGFVDDCATLAGDHPVEVVLGVDAALEVELDVTRVEQVLANLLVNAAAHAPAGTPVEVAVGERDGEHVVVAVRDRGPGVPLAKVPLLFKKYGRLAPSGRGAGIGLYLGRAIARAHGGDLRYVARPGGGSDFRLLLPAPDGGPWRDAPRDR